VVRQQQRYRFTALAQPIQQIERGLPGIGGQDAVGHCVPVTQVTLDCLEHFRIVVNGQYSGSGSRTVRVHIKLRCPKMRDRFKRAVNQNSSAERRR
jgi:hypothetical protein